MPYARFMITPTNKLPQAVRFMLVGGAGSIFNLAVMTLLVEISGSSTIVASAAATELSILHNFLFHRYWTFSPDSRANSFFLALAKFNLSSFFASIINLLTVLALNHLDCWYLTAQAAGILLAWIANYQLASRLVFHPDSEQFTHLQ